MKALPQTEQYWLLIIVLQLVQPYLVFYMLWAHLLPVRILSGRRVALLLAINLAAFITLGRAFSGGQTVWAILFVILVIAVLLPRQHTEKEETVP